MGDSTAVEARGLTKTYVVPVRGAGLREALRSIVRRETRTVEAVRELEFSVAAGEIVGFLGPNGAGKTTTLKILAGLLHPTLGEANVLGHTPARRESAFLRRITLVMGQRNQLLWDLPVLDSLERNRAIYGIASAAYRSALEELVALLELEPLLAKPVRNLSLGERMKCEFAAALLHAPDVLFLDEPTIGLDVSMQRRIRAFVTAYNQRRGATVLLTSHYMADVEALCRRVIVIHRGRLLFDGALDALVERFSGHKTISLELAQGSFDLRGYGEVLEHESGRVQLRVPRADTPRVTARLLAELPVLDLSVEDPPIEEVIDRVFREAST